MKKILIISRSFYPIIAPRSFRATELAKEFARQGHDVTVLTHAKGYDYSAFSNEYRVNVIDFVENKWFDFKTNGTGFLTTIKKVIIVILKYFFLFPDIQLTWILKRHLKRYTNFDILISIAVPYSVHFGVALAKSKNKNLTKLWIADCGDPFTGNKERSFPLPFYFKIIEKWFCRKPDFLTVPIKEAIVAYPTDCQQKIKVIPQGFNFKEYSLHHEYSPNPIPHFAYAGALSAAIRDPRPFLTQLLSITTDFRFFIYTRNQKIVAPFIARLGEKLIVLDYVPRNELLMQLSKMDFLINFENKDIVQAPSKLIDYALTGRPILSVSSLGVNPGHFRSFLMGDYKHQWHMPNLDQYRIEQVSAQFLKLKK